MAVTISDVAKRAKVSATTVSLCFKDDTRISEPTRQRVLGVAKEIGYVPNQFARRLRSGQSKLIALIVPEIDTPFISDMVITVEEALARDGYHVLVFSTFRNIDLEKRAVRAATELSVEGVIIAACEEENDNLRRLSDTGRPIVYIDSLPGKGMPRNCVINDLAGAGRLGTEHLLRQGHTGILLINGPDKHRDFSSFRLLAQSYTDTLERHGLGPEHRTVINEGLYIQDGSNAIERALADNLEFSAVFAVSDWVALGAIQCLERHGRRVPQDVSVMGIDNIAVAELDRISLTTIEMYEPGAGGETMGNAAAGMLLRMIASNNSAESAKEIIFKPRLVFRSSCRQIGPACESVPDHSQEQ